MTPHRLQLMLAGMPDTDVITNTGRRPARVLFTGVPQTGHVTPLLPLARAFADGGADVLVASGPDVGDAVSARGLRFQLAGPALSAWFDRLVARTPGPPGEGLAPDRVERYFIPRLFGEVGLAAMSDGLDEAVQTFRPDLLIFEPHALAAPLVAARHGVLAVQHTIGLPWEPLVLELVADAVTPAWRAADLPTPPAAGLQDGPTVEICPPSLSGTEGTGSTAPRRVLPLRPAPAPRSDLALPVEVPDPGRPLVYVTLGTFANSDTSLFRAILDALADLPVNVLVTAGTEAAAAQIGEPPVNATVTGFVPQAAILPHCAAVVHHAGAGTMFGVLAHGLPSVALPQSADNFRNARHLGAAGAAHVLMPDQAAGLRDAVSDVLAQRAYRDAAAGIAAEIAAMPAATDLVPSLLDAVANHHNDMFDSHTNGSHKEALR